MAGDDDHEFPPPGQIVQAGAAPALPALIGDGARSATIAAPAPHRRRGMARFYAYTLSAKIDLAGGIWIIYLQDRGFSIAQIGLAEACFHLAPVTLELPSGSLADVVGRKWALMIGSLLVAISAALMLGAGSLWMVLLAMYLNGASYAFRSGAEQAFLYDTMAAQDATSGFARLFGRVISMSYLIIGLTVWFGAVLAGVSFTWPYAITIGVGLAAAFLAAGLREPERERTTHRGMTRTIREAIAIVRGRPGLAALLGFGAGLWTLLTLIGLYAQAVLAEHGLRPATIGLVIGGTLVCTAIGSWIAHRVSAWVAFTTWTVIVAIAIVCGGVALGSGLLVVGIAVYLVAEFTAGLYEPLLADRINASLSASHRATILSVEGFLFSITMIWAFPLFGWVAGRYGWLPAYAGGGAVVLILLAVWLALSRRQTARALA